MRISLSSRFQWETWIPWLSVTLLVAAIAVPLGIFSWLIFSTNIFTIQAITVVDARPHTTEAVRSLINEEVSKLSTLFPKQSIFFIRSKALENKIRSTIPQVRTVYVSRQLPGTVKAVIQEKKPALRLLSNTHYYFVDTEGTAYEEATIESLPGTVLPTVKNKDISSTVRVGSPVVAPAFVQFVLHMQEELPKHVPAQVAEIKIPSLAAREVTFRLSNNWDIRFDSTRSTQTQIAILDKLLNSTIPEAEKATLEYIDLRIQNRAYYKTTSVGSGSE